MITDIDDYRPYNVRELMCIACFKRWIAVYPDGLKLKDFECPDCKKTGAVIATGEFIFDD